MRAENKQKLEAQFVGIEFFSIARKTVLPSDLAELAWPIRQNRGETGVAQISVLGASAAVKAAANGPPAREPVLAGRVEAKGPLCFQGGESRKLIAVAPNQLGARQE